MIYFLVWTRLVFGPDLFTNERLLRRISAGGLVIYVVLMTLAGVDWIMSRQAHWSSSIFGFIIVISQTLTALCFTIVILWSRAERSAIARFAKPKHFIDLGNMLLMFVILWAYMNFAQYLITWTGNEQPDIGWYVQRTYGGWRVVAGIIIFIHFLLPFFLLLMRPLKRDIHRLGAICAALLGPASARSLLEYRPADAERSARRIRFVAPGCIGMAGHRRIVVRGVFLFPARAPLLALQVNDPGSTYGASEPQSA